MKKLVVGTVTAAGAALLLGGCGFSITATVNHEDLSYGLDVARLERLSFDLSYGDAEIVGTDAKTVSVHEHLSYTKNRRPTPFHTQQGNTLSLGYTCPGGLTIGDNTCSVSYRVQVPRALALQLKDGSGNLTLRSLRGDVQAHLGSGDVQADDLGGGRGVLGTDAGNIRVAGAAGPLEARTASGDLTLTGLRSGNVRARSDSGNVRLGFAAVPATVDAGSASGDVHVALPPGQSYAVDATTASGTSRVDVQNAPASPHKIRAHTSSGNVEVTGA